MGMRLARGQEGGEDCKCQAGELDLKGSGEPWRVQSQVGTQ